jgi:hypothetical protein
MFKSANILSQHQKRTKYCLALQGKENKNFTCSYCDKSLVTNERLITHTAICKEKKKKDDEEKDFNLKSKYKKELKDIIKKMEEKDKLNIDKLEEKDRYYTEQIESHKSKYNEQIDTLKQTIAKLEAKLEKFEEIKKAGWLGAAIEELREDADFDLKSELAAHSRKMWVGETVMRGPILFRRAEYNQYGGFDIMSFFLGNDDHDLFLRARQRGKNVAFTPLHFSSPLW